MSTAQCSDDLCNNTLQSQFLAGKKSSRNVTHSISWWTFYLPVVTGSGHGILFCDVVLSCESCSCMPAMVWLYSISFSMGGIKTAMCIHLELKPSAWF